jgi:UDP-galactose transporter B1
MFGAMSAVGQIFIFRAVNQFGPLTLSIITTIRKFSTFFLSLIIFGHAIT